VEDFIIDDETWAIRYLEVDTRNWWPGKRCSCPQLIEHGELAQSPKSSYNLSRETIKNGPEYFESMPITREYENRLYSYYGRPAYGCNYLSNRAAVRRAKG